MKKLISAVLSLVLAISAVGTAVMAEEDVATVTSTEVTEEIIETTSDEATVEETEEVEEEITEEVTEEIEEEEETTSAEEDAASEDEEENNRLYSQMSEEIALVSALGIKVDTNKLNQGIERHDFATMLLTILDKDGVAGANVTFHDVTPENSYYNNVMSAALFGVLHGDGIGYANPERNLSYNEAVKMAVVALDMQYQNYADALGGYPDGYLKLADSLGLTKKISQRSGSVSYATAIKILYNMMYANYYKVEIVQNNYVLQKSDETNLEHYYGLTKYEGIITNTPYTLSVLGNETPDVIEIDGTVYKLEIGTEFDADDALGKSVFYYLDDENVVRVIVPKVNKNTVLEIPARDIIPENPAPENPTSIRYYPNGQDKEKRASFPGATFFYNGSLCTDLEPGDLYPTDGKVTLVDNDGDNSYEYVIIESYVQYVAQSSSFGTITSKYDPWTIEAGEESNIRLYRDGVEVTAAFIGEWDSLKVMMPKSGTGGIINVSGKEITGKVEKFTRDDYGNKVAVIKGKEYRIAKVYQDAIDAELPTAKIFETGYNVTLALDDDNAIIGVKDVKNGAGEYGYLVKIYGGEKTIAKIFTTSGTMIKVDVADKVKIDETKYNVSEGSIESLEGILIDSATGDTYDQLIKYKMNSKGLISEIDTAEDKTTPGHVTTGDFSLCYRWLDASGNFPHSTETYTLGSGQNYRVSSNSKAPFFFVPGYEGATDDDYYVYDGYSDWWTYTKDATLEIYDAVLMNPNFNLKNVGAMVARTRWSNKQGRPDSVYSMDSRNKYVVLDVNSAVDEDDEEVYIVDLVLDNNGMRSEAVIFEKDAFNVDTQNWYGGAGKTVADLKPGDLINIKYDNERLVNRKVTGFIVFANAEWYGDPEKEKIYSNRPDLTWPDANIDTYLTISYGTVVYSSGEEFILRTRNDVSSQDVYIPFIAAYTAGNVYVYDTYSKEIQQATKSHLVAGARVVCSGSFGTNFGTVIVIND